MSTAFNILVFAGGVAGFIGGLWLVIRMGERRSIYDGERRWGGFVAYLLPFTGMVAGVIGTHELLRWLG